MQGAPSASGEVAGAWQVPLASQSRPVAHGRIGGKSRQGSPTWLAGAHTPALPTPCGKRQAEGSPPPQQNATAGSQVPK